jgi:hypothetical protein
MKRKTASILTALAMGVFLPAASEAGVILFEASGANAGAIQGTVDAFRAALGNPNNGNSPAPLAAGRREINWDGGGATTSAVSNGTNFTVFLNTRGSLSTTPGTGFAQATLVETVPADVTLAEIVGNPTYTSTFSTFSPARIFTPLGSNITDATFFVPGSSTPAGVSAFGAVFSDVDLFGPTRIDFFGPGDALLFSRSVLAGPNGQSFLGVQFNAGEQITRARITTGTAALGPNDNPTGGVDMVVMDDFIYAEPQAIPEPATMALLGLGLAAAASRRRRTR